MMMMKNFETKSNIPIKATNVREETMMIKTWCISIKKKKKKGPKQATKL
jgi:hypothetical protein